MYNFGFKVIKCQRRGETISSWRIVFRDGSKDWMVTWNKGPMRFSEKFLCGS